MLVALLLCCFLSISVQADTRIGAFNVQVFGKTKFGNTEVVETLTKVYNYVSSVDSYKIYNNARSTETMTYTSNHSKSNVCTCMR